MNGRYLFSIRWYESGNPQPIAKRRFSGTYEEALTEAKRQGKASWSACVIPVKRAKRKLTADERETRRRRRESVRIGRRSRGITLMLDAQDSPVWVKLWERMQHGDSRTEPIPTEHQNIPRIPNGNEDANQVPTDSASLLLFRLSTTAYRRAVERTYGRWGLTAWEVRDLYGHMWEAWVDPNAPRTVAQRAAWAVSRGRKALEESVRRTPSLFRESPRAARIAPNDVVRVKAETGRDRITDPHGFTAPPARRSRNRGAALSIIAYHRGRAYPNAEPNPYRIAEAKDFAEWAGLTLDGDAIIDALRKGYDPTQYHTGTYRIGITPTELAASRSRLRTRLHNYYRRLNRTPWVRPEPADPGFIPPIH